MGTLLTFGGAHLSEDRKHRYLLWRPTGASGGKVCTFVMLNPSTADERENDATVRRCVNYARGWGYSTLKIVNLWSYRATHPADLKRMVEQAGVEHVTRIVHGQSGGGVDSANINHVRLACAGQRTLVVCAWGTHGSFLGRDSYVTSVLQSEGVQLHALAFTKDGAPKHPVRLRKDLQPLPWAPRSQLACP